MTLGDARKIGLEKLRWDLLVARTKLRVVGSRMDGESPGTIASRTEQLTKQIEELEGFIKQLSEPSGTNQPT